MTLKDRIFLWLVEWRLSSISYRQQSLSQTSRRRLRGLKELRLRFSSRYLSLPAFTSGCAEIGSRAMRKFMTAIRERRPRRQLFDHYHVFSNVIPRVRPLFGLRTS